MKLRTKKAGVLALAATAAMAVGGVGAGSANASLLTACTGASTVHGEGSSLQKAAQSIWTVQFNRNTNGCTAAGAPTSSYTPTSSGQFMNNKWNADLAHTFDTTVHYGGTDDAPTTTQISNINSNLGGASVLSVPVAQAAIAIIVNPPTGCTISSITPADLELVFHGTTTTWAGITGSSGCGTSRITRVVRADSSGTTYQLKHYLGAQLAAGTNVCSARTASWADLQLPANNLIWPSTCDGPPSTGVTYSLAGGVGPAAGSGGGDEARTVANTAGSIGYVALSDARTPLGTNNYKWLTIRTSARITVDPSTNGAVATRGNSNCTTTSGAYGTSLPSATTTWSGVYLTNAGGLYPICTLTWDLAVTDYSRTWGATGQRIATTVHDYLRYINVTRGGVADALTSANDYQAVPNGTGAGDVQAAAATGIGQIVD